MSAWGCLTTLREGKPRVLFFPLKPPLDFSWGRTGLVLGKCLSFGWHTGSSPVSRPRSSPAWQGSPSPDQLHPGLTARIAHSFLNSAPFFAAASCEGLSGSGLEAVGREAAGPGKPVWGYHRTQELPLYILPSWDGSPEVPSSGHPQQLEAL